MGLGGCQTYFSPQQTPSVEAEATVDTPEIKSALSIAVLEVALEPAPNWYKGNHVHGLAVDPTNPQRIYLATHYGLVHWDERQQWSWLQPEAERADYMGFSADPENPNRFYASGHPPTGGNLGFQITDDRAQTWRVESMANVDFHALAIAPSDPQQVYGFATSGAYGLHHSIDGGQTWRKPKTAGLTVHPFNLVVNPSNAAEVYAVTEAGLFLSEDSGDSWSMLPTPDPMIGLAVQSNTDQTILYGYRLNETHTGLYRSDDRGETWELWSTELDDVILYLAIAPSDPDIFYAANRRNQVFQSKDRGQTWQELVGAQ